MNEYYTTINPWIPEKRGKEGGGYNLASMRRDPTPTIRFDAFSITIVKYESLRFCNHAKRSAKKVSIFD